MAAKNKRRITGYDIHNTLGAHVGASLKAYACDHLWMTTISIRQHPD
jgi:hypothetical protein